MPEARTESQTLADMQGVFEQVAAQTGELGLNFSVWDTESQPVRVHAPAGDLCQHLCPKDRCREVVLPLVRQVAAAGEGVCGRAEHGCCVVAAPILKRRRMVGVAAACFPVREILDDEESFAHLCDRMKLDRQAVESLARHCCRHSAAQGQDFLRILDWMLSREHDVKTGREELTTLSRNLSITYEELSLVYQISGTTQVTQPPEEFLQNICDELFELFDIPMMAVVYARPPAIEDDFVVGADGKGPIEPEIRGFADRSILPNVTQAQGPVVENHAPLAPGGGGDAAVRNYLAVPLNVGESCSGMLIGFNKDGDFDTVDLKLLNSIGSQAGTFLANSRLFADLQDLLMGVLHALTATIDAKDPYTCGHSHRVASISRKIAEACGYPPDKVQRIYLAGLLHDIGKIGVPEAVLCKPGRLTDDEYEIIKTHPATGTGILGGIRQLDDVIPAILSHHERPDGKGYPRGLPHDQIPIGGMIVGLADCFDAMTSDRIYRRALSLETVCAEIRRHAGTQFDPDLVEKFLAMDMTALMEDLYAPAETVFPVESMKECAT